MMKLKALIQEYLEKKEYQKPTTLCALMKSMGSDKGDSCHNYTTFYAKLFKKLRNKYIKIFELGIGTNYLDVPSNMGAEGNPGASLYAWEKYFPKAEVYGADIDKRILFQTPIIKTFYCDQTDPLSIFKMFNHKDLIDSYFDIMIDDGLHEFNANLNFLIYSIKKLRRNGIYIVEDLTAETEFAFEQIKPALQKKLSLQEIEIVTIPSEVNKFNNVLLVIIR